MMKRIISAISTAGRVAIISHVRPDGDTIGSSLALRDALLQKGKSVMMFCDDDPPKKFSYMSGFEAYNPHSPAGFDLAVAVDCSDELRLGGCYEIFRRAGKTINIDHHPSNTKFADINFVDRGASATAVIMYDVIKELGAEITCETAECLYTGISTDTGNFSHSNTDARSFYLAYELCNLGVDVSKIVTTLYKSSQKCRTLLLGRAISGMRFFDDDRIAVMTVTKADIAEFGAEDSCTEGYIDHAIGISGVDVAVCIMQHAENSYKISFRSKGADVCGVAMTFGGGGHRLASGCMINGFYEDVVDRIVAAIRYEL